MQEVRGDKKAFKSIQKHDWNNFQCLDMEVLLLIFPTLGKILSELILPICEDRSLVFNCIWSQVTGGTRAAITTEAAGQGKSWITLPGISHPDTELCTSACVLNKRIQQSLANNKSSGVKDQPISHTNNNPNHHFSWWWTSGGRWQNQNTLKWCNLKLSHLKSCSKHARAKSNLNCWNARKMPGSWADCYTFNMLNQSITDCPCNYVSRKGASWGR